jgi:hypothetical protein
VNPIISVFVLFSTVTSRTTGRKSKQLDDPINNPYLGMLLGSFESELAITPYGFINLQQKSDYVEITLNRVTVFR